MNTTPKGETIPQTVENLQAIMAKDAARMQKMAKDITELQVRNTKLTARLVKVRDTNTSLRAQLRAKRDYVAKLLEIYDNT